MSETVITGKRPPGEWQHGTTGGGWITFRLPAGKAAGEFDPGPEEVVELVMEIHGDYDDPKELRRVTLWAVAYQPERIVMNYRDVGVEVDEVTGVLTAADAAEEWMREHPGEATEE